MPHTIFNAFLCDGQLAGIRLGDSLDQVRTILGNPLDTSPPSGARPHTTLWKYDSLQLAFVDSALPLIAFYFWDSETPSLPAALGGQLLPFTLASTQDQLKAYVRTLGLTQRPQVATDPTVIVLSSNVIVAFDDDGTLRKILATAPQF